MMIAIEYIAWIDWEFVAWHTAALGKGRGRAFIVELIPFHTHHRWLNFVVH
jgi:hypothetical protein